MTRDEERVADIVAAAERIREITDRGRDAFDSDHILQAALTYNIQIIGEAAMQLSEAARADSPDVPWSDIIGMRNIVVHRYFQIDLDLVWQAGVVAVPDLKKKLGA